MSKKTFGMFSKDGDKIINAIVLAAKANKYDWDMVEHLLEGIATIDGFEEATDTEVREAVYIELYENAEVA